jgi:16S rRNA (adenine1518-N6/adenine1519-N6)-dimethyltransferase
MIFLTMELTAVNADQKGQHFMIDRKIIKFIVDHALLLKEDLVLEIGYGHGELTREITKKCTVIAVDIEDNSSSLSKESNKGIIFVHDNILRCFRNLYEKHRFNKIVSNIPYNISEPLIRQIFKTDVELIIITVGEAFAKILTSFDNRIGIIANALYDVEILLKVPPKAFMPAPKNSSAVIMLKPKPLDSISRASAIYKGLVLLDDKKLKNSLETVSNMTKRTSKEIIKGFGLNFLDKKLYQLTNEEFLELSYLISEKLAP